MSREQANRVVWFIKRGYSVFRTAKLTGAPMMYVDLIKRSGI